MYGGGAKSTKRIWCPKKKHLRVSSNFLNIFFGAAIIFIESSGYSPVVTPKTKDLWGLIQWIRDGMFAMIDGVASCLDTKCYQRQSEILG